MQYFSAPLPYLRKGGKIVRMTHREHLGFGIDIGGSGIKGAVVDLDRGEFVGDRFKIATPQPSTPDSVAQVTRQIVEHFDFDGPVGITLPSIVHGQRAHLAANIDASWVGTDLQELFHRHLGKDREISVLNDADAAGLAEVAFGVPEARTGAVIFLTLGTGIGSAFLTEGRLFPNTELGHLIIDGKHAEHIASSAVKDRKELSFKKWAKRVDKVLSEYARLFSPDLFVIGGGISRKADKWMPHLTIEVPVVPAKLRNTAGIVGAAMAVDKHLAP